MVNPPCPSFSFPGNLQISLGGYVDVGQGMSKERMVLGCCGLFVNLDSTYLYDSPFPPLVSSRILECMERECGLLNFYWCLFCAFCPPVKGLLLCSVNPHVFPVIHWSEFVCNQDQKRYPPPRLPLWHSLFSCPFAF